MSNRLDPDQARHIFGPDLAPNCLQNLYKQTARAGKEELWDCLHQASFLGRTRLKDVRKRFNVNKYHAI